LNANRDTSGIDGARRSTHTERPEWYERSLPDHWDEDEVRFFRNWMKELASLHRALTTAAPERLKLLRRARMIYFKLAHKLTVEIREAAIRASDAANVVEEVRR